MRGILVLVLLTCSPLAARAQATCPPDDPSSRGQAALYVTQQQFASHRQTLGIDSIGMDGLRTLTDRHDLTMCQRLVAQFGAHESQPNWRWSAYAIGRYYLVA